MLNKQNNPKLNYALRLVALPLFALVIFAFSVRTKEEKARSASPLVFAHRQTDTLPKKEKQIESVDLNKAKGLLTIYYGDGSCETLTEQEASKRGLINDGGFGNAKRGTARMLAQGTKLTTKNSLQNPLYVIDNVEASSDLANSLDPNSIASINVLKGDMAAKIYGEKGKNGVIEITTKAYNATALRPHPIYFVDGVETNDMNSVDPSRIESINILKGPSAIAKYGEKGSNGIIEIKTKKTVSDKTIAFRLDDKDLTDGEIKTVDWDKGSFKMKETFTLTDSTPSKEPIFTQTETPASIDKKVWQEFLSNNLQPLIENAVKKGMKPGTYAVNVRFIVKKDGSLADIQALNDPGYDLSKRLLVFMPNSPKWNPAVQNGRLVDSYHTQPVNFVIQ